MAAKVSKPKNKNATEIPLGRAPDRPVRQLAPRTAKSKAKSKPPSSTPNLPASRLQPTDASVAQGAEADKRAAAWLRRPRAIYSQIPEFATTTRGQSTFAHAYLTENRLLWWNLALDAQVPASGAIRLDPAVAGERASSAFQQQFFSTLATVAGTRLAQVGSELQFDGFNNVVPRARQIPWDADAAPVSVNTLAGAEFYVAASAQGAATLTAVNVLGPLGNGDAIALVTPAGVVSAPTVTINFVLPQRAVGLECGFLGEPDFDADSFLLVARDARGQTIATSAGSELDTNNWRSSQVRFIGVIDQHGGISSVQLSCTDPGFAAGKQFFVTRIWYECLPPAVMLQGTACNVAADEFAAAQHAGHPDVVGFLAENPLSRSASWGPIRQSPIQIELPYRCDSAVVLMRGFKLAHTDASATKIQRMTAHLSSQLNGTTLTIRFSGELARGAPDSTFDTGVIGEPPYSSRADATLGGVYYTLLAWESARIDLHASPAEPNESHMGNQALYQFELPNRHPASQDIVGVAEERMGPLLGTVRGIRYAFDAAQEIQGLAFIPGARGGVDDGGRVAWDQVGVSLEDVLLPTILWAAGAWTLIPWAAGRGLELDDPDNVLLRLPPLAYSDFGRHIRWSFGTDLRDTASDDVGVRTGFSGSVLNGSSLDVPSNIGAFGLDTNGPHAAQRKLEIDPWFAVNGTEFADSNVPVDMPIVGIGPHIFIPEDDLRELDVEVRAESFDGRQLTIFVGGGIDLMPSTDDSRFVMGLPVVGGLRRNTSRASHRVSARNVLFRTPRGLLALAPVEHGALRNDGNTTLLIDSMELTGVARDEYNLKVDYRGTEIAVWDVAARGPLLLEPGESVIIGGAFYAQPPRPRKRGSSRSDSEPVEPPLHRRAHLAVLSCHTNQPGYGTVDIFVRADIVPTDAIATVLPQLINFGVFQMLRDPQQQYPRQRGLLVTSDGSTPVFISALAVEPPLPAFEYRLADAPTTSGSVAPGAIYQLDPGTSLAFYVFFNPAAPGMHETSLRIETNAGSFAVTLRGEAVRL